MPRYYAVGRTVILTLALVLAVVTCRAEGLVFFEQRDPVGQPLLAQLRTDPTQIVIDLGGPWEAVTDRGKTHVTTWLPGGFWGESKDVRYRRTFALADSLRKWNFQLFLPEINYSVQVWMNGRLVSSFTGGHLGFSCDVSRELLNFGTDNEILLKVSNKLSATGSLPLSPGILQPRNYGGLFSGVYLRGVPAWSIEDAKITSAKPANDESPQQTAIVRIAQYASASGAVDSAQIGRADRVYVALWDTSGHVVAEARRDLAERSADEEFQLTVPLPRFSPDLWSPDSPVLYQFRTVLLAGGDTLHRLVKDVGFKRLEVRDGEILLNGVRLKVRGMDYVPEDPYGSCAPSLSQLVNDVQTMKELGINLIRVPFGPPPPALANIADQMGCLLLVEAGVDGIPAEFFADPKLQTLAEQAYSRLADAYGDHVSVMAWGIGSQLDWQQPSVQRFEESMRAYLWERDKRPCYVETDQLSETGPADFVLLGNPDDVLGAEFPLPKRNDIPIILSRVGRLVSPGDPLQTNVSAGLVNQADYLIRRINAVNASESIDGYVLHSLADYHGADPLFVQPNRMDPCLYGFGVLSLNRTERVAYFRLRDLVQTGQAATSVPTSLPVSTPLTFPVAGLAALLITSIEMRRNNVFRQNMKRVFLHPHGFHMDLRYRRFLHTVQPLLLWLIEAVTLSLIVVSLLYALRTSVLFDHYVTQFVPFSGLKAGLVNLIWNPTNAVLFFAAAFLVFIVLLAIVVRLISIPFRERMDMWQATNYVVWSFAAVLFVLPISAILYRLVETPGFKTPALVIVVIGLVWSLQRLLGALRVGLGTSAWRVYLSAIVVAAIIIIGGAALLNHELGTLAYLEHFQRVLGPR